MNGARSSWRASPLPPDWPRIRQAILERDDWTCRIRGAGCQVRANEVDHIVPGGDHRPGNLWAVCGVCHRAKTNSENAARMHARRSLRRPAERHPGLIDREGRG